jgi:hypothetical protein
MMLTPFTDPQLVKKRSAARAAWATTNAIPYSDFRLPRALTDVGVIAETFQPDNPLAEIFPDVEPSADMGNMLLSPDGALAYRRAIVPRDEGLPIVSSPSMWQDDGRVYFTDDIIVPTLLFQRKPDTRWTVWMGLTPFELRSQQSGIRAATKHVVLGGLGMGWLLSQIVKKPTVKSVVVIEQDRNLIDWFGQQLCDALPKVQLVCGDVWEEARKYDKNCRFILDVWPSHGDAEWDCNLADLRRDGYHCWAWGSPRGPRRYR